MTDPSRRVVKARSPPCSVILPPCTSVSLWRNARSRRKCEALKLGDGEIFRGEGILAVTKALLQSGVAYVGGYQGAPVSHLLDVLVDAEDMLAELGVHLETCTNEASAAAMLGASINYPLRGAVTWKSIVGTNVAADALSNLSSPGVIGGALIILGEDYGEGASVIQERSYAYAMKSSMWLLDPRPDLPTIVRMVEKGFELSEASHAPGDAGAARARLPRHRRIRRQGPIAPRRSPASTASRARRASTMRGSRIRRARSCRRGSRSTSACPPRRPSSREHKLNEISRRRLDGPRHHRARRADQHACCARSRASASPTLSAHRACRSTCSTSPIR